jgi:hypothetical protein
MPFCNKCGKEIIEGSQFCQYCGEKLTHILLTKSSLKIREEEDLIAFIGNNAHKYLSKFKKFNIAGVDNFTVTWHWPAFLIGPFWMLYRKLYLWALIAFVVGIIPYVGWLTVIVWGMIGNYLYYKHVKKKISELRILQPSSDISITLSQIGGVNRWVVTVAIIISAIVFILIVLAFLILQSGIGRTK